MTDRGSVGIGLFGFGNIGAGVVRTLTQNREIIRRNLGLTLDLRRIVDIDIESDRGVDTTGITLSKNKDDITGDASISVVIELIGGAGIARTIVQECLEAGKHVVTANKELMAKCGPELAKIAAANNVKLLYEASVGGGIPVLAPMLTCLRANRIRRILGIVNGTTNYILTQMQDKGAAFDDVLKDAQALGFAEADPTNDVEGYDARYKTVVLCSAGFGKRVDVADIYCEGITKITTADMKNAGTMGYTVKLLSFSESLDDGSVTARVHPALVPLTHPLATISGVLNAVYLEGDPVGPLMFVGQGAGPSATSSAVLGDVIALATDTISKTSTDLHEPARLAPMAECSFPYYIRMNVLDRAGVLAEITRIFGDKRVSIKSMHQSAVSDDGAEIIWITHPAPEQDLQDSLAAARALDCVRDIPAVIRVLED